MQLIVLFLSIGCLSMANDTEEEILRILENYVDDGETNPIDSKVHKLKLSDQYLDSTSYSVTWKAEFDGEEVVIKIFTEAKYSHEEIATYEALNAAIDPSIEDKGVQKVYYVGKIFEKYPVIVLSPYDDSLEARLEKQSQFFSPYSTFQVFLQSVKALKFLQRKKVTHNDISPKSISLRGKKVFVGEFDSAALNGRMNNLGSAYFGSRRFWQGDDRTPMDDLESLVFTIWHIAGVHTLDRNENSLAGSTMSTQNADQNMDFVLGKCEHFVNFTEAQKACEFICVHELLLSDEPVPAYNKIIRYLEAAVKEIEQKTGQTAFEWIPSTSS